MKIEPKCAATKGTNGRIRTAFSVTAFAIALAQCQGQAPPVSSQSIPAPKKLYIEERIKTTTGVSMHCDDYGNCYGGEGTHSRNVSLEVTREVLKRCPSILTVTDNREAADFDLRISPGSSALYKQNGDVAYQSPAKFRVSSLAKDVCGFVAALTPLAPVQSQAPPTMINPALLPKAQAGGDSTPLASPVSSRSQTPSKGIDPALLAKAQVGDAAAERQVGQTYFIGEDVPQDFMNAANWFRKAAEQGDAGAQTMLGLLYDTGQGVKQDYAQAEIWYRKAAEQGDPGGQTGLGSLYYDGDSVKQDYAQAAIWYRKAAQQGNEGAQLGLGLLYDNGEGLPQDYSQAAFWYRKAAEQGNAGAQFSLGVLYHNGHGLPQDYAQAAAWYRKAAEQGFADAQTSLGLLYLAGKGVPQDYTQAAAWYLKAAEQGNDKAQYGLGVLLEYGYGVPKNYPDAYFWLSIAAASTSGSSQAVAAKSRDDVAAKLTPEDLSKAQQRATTWFAAHQAQQ